MEDVTIEHGLAPRHRWRAAEIVYEAFRRKFDPLLGTREHALALFAASLQADRALVALQRGEVVGLAGLQYGGRKSLVYRWPDVAREYGLLRGLPRMAVLHFLGSPARPGELAIEHLAVAAALRGRGIGTRLVETACALARSWGLDVVRLDVVDTNPGARRLYERLGFQPTDTLRFPLLFRLAGFSAITTMVKRLDRASAPRPPGDA